MDLSKINFTQDDVREFMDSLDIDAILENIDHMPSDDQYESSFLHNFEFNKDELKFTKSRVNNRLYKYGHITKEGKDYLDRIDALALMKANRNQIQNITNLNINHNADLSDSNNKQFVKVNMNSQEVAAV